MLSGLSLFVHLYVIVMEMIVPAKFLHMAGCGISIVLFQTQRKNCSSRHRNSLRVLKRTSVPVQPSHQLFCCSSISPPESLKTSRSSCTLFSNCSETFSDEQSGQWHVEHQACRSCHFISFHQFPLLCEKSWIFVYVYKLLLVQVLKAVAILGEMRGVGVIEFEHACKSIAASKFLLLSTLIVYRPSASFGKAREKGSTL